MTCDFFLKIKNKNCDMKQCAPNHLLVHKDGALLKKKGNLNPEASCYTSHHPNLKLLAIIIFKIS